MIKEKVSITTKCHHIQHPKNHNIIAAPIKTCLSFDIKTKKTEVVKQSQAAIKHKNIGKNIPRY